MTFIHAPLLQPLRIGAMTIQNRFCAGPLTLPSLQGPFGEFSPDGLAYFEAADIHYVYFMHMFHLVSYLSFNSNAFLPFPVQLLIKQADLISPPYIQFHIYFKSI